VRTPLPDRLGECDLFGGRLAYSLIHQPFNAVVDYEGGGAFMCEMTDCEAPIASRS